MAPAPDLDRLASLAGAGPSPGVPAPGGSGPPSPDAPAVSLEQLAQAPSVGSSPAGPARGGAGEGDLRVGDLSHAQPRGPGARGARVRDSGDSDQRDPGPRSPHSPASPDFALSASSNLTAPGGVVGNAALAEAKRGAAEAEAEVELLRMRIRALQQRRESYLLRRQNALERRCALERVQEDQRRDGEALAAAQAVREKEAREAASRARRARLEASQALAQTLTATQRSRAEAGRAGRQEHEERRSQLQRDAALSLSQNRSLVQAVNDESRAMAQLAARRRQLQNAQQSLRLVGETSHYLRLQERARKESEALRAEERALRAETAALRSEAGKLWLSATGP